ncbi:MAG: hemolysin family protein [Eubacteriales bacterium]|nr:hemolysin family protein [Eubacteriales bacterium]
MDDPSGSSLFNSVLLIIVLTLVNAFLAGAEMAFVSLNPAKIKQLADEGGKKAKRVQKLLADSDSFLSAIQVGITVGGFFNSASASQAFVGQFSPLFGASQAAETIATLIVTLIISYITLVLGELYPKQLALQIPEQFAMMSSGPIMLIKLLFNPFIKLLNISTGLLKKLTPIDFSKKEEKLTRSEMKALLNSSRNDGAIDLDEFNMMRGVLSLDSRFVTEIMVPRVDAEMIDLQEELDLNIKRLMEYKHSRVPLYDDDKDNIVGIVHLVDVLINWDALTHGKLSLKQIARPALFVPETLMTDELLVKFRTAKTQMAIIVDEFGGVEGLVTLDDLLSEIVGDIIDEHSDLSDISIRKISDNEYLMKGSTPLSDLNRMFDMQIFSDEADTIAGYIITQLGYIPKPRGKEKLTFKQYSFIVMSATPTRILGVRMTVHD